jgi:hypothetical protein
MVLVVEVGRDFATWATLSRPVATWQDATNGVTKKLVPEEGLEPTLL